jgi:TRAP-type transport system small permease protein
MALLLGLLAPFQMLNTHVLRLGRGIAVVCMALMVIIILTQVFFRYVLNDALNWPDEAARFLMLWMTGLIAPTAFRRGGFVSIDMVLRMLPRTAGALVSLALLCTSLLVLIVATRLGMNHVNSGCLFNSATLRIPFTLHLAFPVPFTDLSATICTKDDYAFRFEWGWTRLKLAHMYASIYVGIILLTLVNIELILRAVITVSGGGDRLPVLSTNIPAGAE